MKRSLFLRCVSLFCVFCLICVPVQSAGDRKAEMSRASSVAGDLDGNGRVDNRDVEYLLWYTLFPEDYTLNQSGNFDGIGSVDNKDVEYLLWHTLFPEDYPLPEVYPAPSDNSVLMFARNGKTMFVGVPERLDVFYYGDKTLRWYVSNPRGITVDQTGLITTIYEGDYEVYVTDGEYTAVAYIFSIAGWGMATGIYFDDFETTLTVGQSTLIPVNGASYDSWVSYHSSDPSVLSVSGHYVTAVSPGKAILTAKDNPYAANMIVTVVDDPLAVHLNIQQESVSLHRLESIQLEWEYNGTGTLEWSTSDSDVARVEDGLVTVYDEGECKIYVTDGTYADFCTVTSSLDPSVKVESLKLYSLNAPLYEGVTKYKGDYMTFKVHASPGNASYYTRIRVSDRTVVSCSYEGIPSDRVFRLDFKKAGTCVLDIISGDGEVITSYTIHIKEDYECNPGPGQLTPEEFVNAYNGVAQAIGMDTTCIPGYLVLTLSDEELTWDMARRCAEGASHHWYQVSIAQYHNPYLCLTYEGVNEDGNHVFYEHR